jgi:hypothetical protein
MSMFGGGSFGGFTLGLDGNLGRVTPSGAQAIQPTAGTVMQPRSGGGVLDWITGISGIASDWYKTTQAVDVANEQIRAGQYPTAIGQNGQLSGTANISSAQQFGSSSFSPGMLFAIAIVVVIVMLLKK